ncbi:MAG: EamA family transporter RarD [Verrucomicrobia bacterium]|nr:MAG: EamA family transporter RarD [Verrucomicrobiota bacterium]
MSIPGKYSAKSRETSALIAGIAAFTTWGLIPVYWKLLKAVPASEILAHRFLWTTIFLSILLGWQGRWTEVKATVRSRRATLYCLASGSLIGINWFLFIWAVNIGRVIETSLGYFMTPLVSVLFGAIFLRERLTLWQSVSVSLGTVAVLNLTFGYGRFPWVAVLLCMTFGLYGLLRKKSATAAIPGLFLETTFLVPLAIAYLIYLRIDGGLFFGRAGWLLSILLVSTGIVTAVPLFWFGYAARNLRLTTLGFLQYLTPIGSFFLGVFLYREPFTRGHLITFSLIWVALAIFTADALLRWRSMRLREAAMPLARPV